MINDVNVIFPNNQNNNLKVSAKISIVNNSLNFACQTRISNVPMKSFKKNQFQK